MASLYIAKWVQFSDDAGDPLNGGKLLFTVTTTTTLKSTYPSEADAIAGTNANVNPIILDADGRSPVEVWITGRYRLRTYTSADVLIADDDPIEDVAGSGSVQGTTSSFGGNNSGSADAIIFTFSPALTSYTNGATYKGRITADNTGAVTIDGGAGAKSLVKRDSAALVSGDLQGPTIIEFSYDSSSDVFRLIDGSASANESDVMKIGVHTIPILASSMISRVTNGATDSTAETSTNKVMIVTKDFDATTQEFVQFYVPMPKSWNEGTVTARFHWTATTGTAAQGVVWGIAGLAISDDDPFEAAFGTAVEVTDAYIASNDLHISAETSAVTIAGTPAEKDFVVFQVYRDPADGSDTKTGDAKLIAVEIFVTYTGANDA